MVVVKEMGWEKVYLHGGSWGSTMCLLFAEFYPEMVLGMVVRGIFLGTKEELDVTFDQSVVWYCLLFGVDFLFHLPYSFPRPVPPPTLLLLLNNSSVLRKKEVLRETLTALRML